MTSNFLIRPAAAMMGRLPYIYKFAVPILVLLAELFSDLDISNQILRQERLGVQYIKAMRPLLQHVPQHRGMTNAYLNGNDAFKRCNSPLLRYLYA